MQLRSIGWLVGISVMVAAAACGKKQDTEAAFATPTVTINHSRAALGSPIEITYRFVVAADATPLQRNMRVFAHFVDADEELMWTDDHDPPVPTTQWKPGQTIEYTRTVFVPVYPYVGDAGIYVGLYSTSGDERRLPSGAIQST